jgi:hypothetical protein
MRIEKDIKGFYIAKGSNYHESFFCFFVDDDGSSWTSRHTWGVRSFETKKEANLVVLELKRRVALKAHRARERKLRKAVLQ